ncbi:NmrA family NAD(P)-binding protein [Streptomyces sp. NPDC055037]
MTYVIHGATGAQGAPVAAALAAAGKKVIAVTRSADTVVSGARVVVADYASTAELTRAYRDAEAVFVHLPLASEDDRRAYARHIAAAVRAAGTARVVFSTSGSPLAPADGGDPDGRAGNAVATLAGGLADSGVSHAVIAPTLFLENLLMPHIVEAVRERGVLPYPMRAGFPVSWASHLDVADVAVALLERPEVTGVVSVGQSPAITAPDLAEAFGARLGRRVRFETVTPEDFRASVAPLIGEGAAADVADLYRALDTLPEYAIALEHSAQKLLGIIPRTASRWLEDIGF